MSFSCKIWQPQLSFLAHKDESELFQVKVWTSELVSKYTEAPEWILGKSSVSQEFVTVVNCLLSFLGNVNDTKEALLEANMQRGWVNIAISLFAAEIKVIKSRLSRMMQDIPTRNRELEIVPALVACEKTLVMFEDQDNPFWKRPEISSPLLISFAAIYVLVAKMALELLETYKNSVGEEMEHLGNVINDYRKRFFCFRVHQVSFPVSVSEVVIMDNYDEKFRTVPQVCLDKKLSCFCLLKQEYTSLLGKAYGSFFDSAKVAIVESEVLAPGVMVNTEWCITHSSCCVLFRNIKKCICNMNLKDLMRNCIDIKYKEIDRTILARKCLADSRSVKSPVYNYSYSCKTCNTSEDELICLSCIRVCHKGHEGQFLCCDWFFCCCDEQKVISRCKLREVEISKKNRDDVMVSKGNVGKGGDTGMKLSELSELKLHLIATRDGVMTTKGKAGSGGDTEMKPSELYYCGRKMNQCRCGRCDGRCGPTNGCPCESCLELVRPTINSLQLNEVSKKNRDGVMATKGKFGSGGDTGMKPSELYYCGRRMNKCRCGRCDGRCDPTNGCPYEASLKLVRPTTNSLQLNEVSKKNSDGIMATKGKVGSGGDTGMKPSELYYCGRKMNQCRCGRCDGSCGPTNGCPCEACLELVRPTTNSLQLNEVSKKNCDGVMATKGKFGSGGDTGMKPSEFYYCGRRMNQCRCGRCDGRCGPTNGCPCEACLELVRPTTNSLQLNDVSKKNRNGVMATKGKFGSGGDTGMKPSELYYCGRRMNQCRCGRCDGSCGPTNGCPCEACLELVRPTTNSLQSNEVSKKNRDGVMATKGKFGSGGDTGMKPSELYYCGRRMNQCRCGRCDGSCGPTNGCPCEACLELVRPTTSSLQSNEVSKKNRDGVMATKGKFGSGGDTGMKPSELYYCGRRMNQCRCGRCDGSCGPTNGCPCEACLELVRPTTNSLQSNEVSKKNRDGVMATKGKFGSGGDTGMKPSELYYCGRKMNQCRCGRCDGRCGPTNGCPCKACFELVRPTTNSLQLNEVSKKNRDGVMATKGKVGPGGDTGMKPSELYYCGRRMNQCRCGRCDGSCGPTNGCPCEACLELVRPTTNSLQLNEVSKKNRDGVMATKGKFGSGGDTGMKPSVLYYCGRRMNQCRCGRCDGRCGPTNGCPCEACLELVRPTTNSLQLNEVSKKNRDGVMATKGKVGPGGDTGMKPSELYYCGRRMNHCRCGRCDGNCGPTNGCPCEACLELVRPTTNSLQLNEVSKKNRDGVMATKGKFGPGGDTGMKPSELYYCGRRMNQCRCGRCDGSCGPTNGCPCEACLELVRPITNSLQLNEVSKKNRDGVMATKGKFGPGGDTGMKPSELYYCGRRMNQCRCGRCDGSCGPTNGCPCEACLELVRPTTNSLQLNEVSKKNRDGVMATKGKFGSGGDTGMKPSEMYYCGRRMNQCRCGRCDGRCGPTNGCPCEACLELVRPTTNSFN